MATALLEVGTQAAPPGLTPRRAFPLAACVHGCAAGFLVVVAIIAAQGLFGGNIHTVVDGLVYRSAQLSGPELEQLLRERRIRTVVNLRGCCAPMDWYLDECRVTHKLHVAQEDISLAAYRLPSTSEMRRLVEVLDHCEYPVLFHCFRGADRTGLASAVAQLVRTNATLEEALEQLSISYGHVRISRTAYLDRFFEYYSDWLAEHGWTHTPDRFRRWIASGYCPGECRCQLRLLNAPGVIPRGKLVALTLRVQNTSIKPWHLRPETNAGIHAMFTIYDSHNEMVHQGRAGLFEAAVGPGESINLTLVLPSIARAGHYHLVVDMMDEQQCSFFATGSDLLEWELDVREQETATGG
jgi:hypothetical protein